MSATYEEAMRSCLLDIAFASEAVLDGRRDNYGENKNQLRVAIKDAKLLYNREDCPNYGYRKP